MMKYIYKILLGIVLLLSNSSFCQDPFVGEIQIFAGNFAPKGWAFCNGQILPINQNQALFALLGTTYGGNGVNTFALPDLRGRVAVGMSNSVAQGEMSGSENNTLLVANLPSHSHTISASTASGNQNLPTGNVPAESSQVDLEYSNASANGVMATNMVSPSGNNQPINNVQPSLGCMYIIALQGIFPTRN